MTPELQQILNAQQQALQQAQFKMYVFGYTTFAAIIICAIFAMLIFWKLCQIQKQLSGRYPAGHSAPFVSPATPQAAPTSPSNPPAAQDVSRYMPKK